MASGVIELSGGGNMYGRIVWSSEQDIASNTSTVRAAVYVSKSAAYTGTTGTFTGAVSIDGSEESGSHYGTVTSDWVEVASIQKTVSHSSDGKGSCTISGYVKGPGGTSLAGKEASGEEDVDLGTIPRNASLTWAENFTDEGNPKITYLNDAGNNAQSLQARLESEDGRTVFAAFRNISKTAGEYTFNLTETERDAIRNYFNSSGSGTVCFFMRCKMGGQNYDSKKTSTVTIVNADPIFSPTVTETNAAVANLTGDSSKMVRFVSGARVTSGAYGIKGASIKSQSIKNGSAMAIGQEAVFSPIESSDFVFQAEDSRGNTAEMTVKKTIVEYVRLTCNIGRNAPDTFGNFTLEVTGNYFSKTFGRLTNTLTVQYRYKVANGAYSAWVTMTPTVTGDAYRAQAVFNGLDYKTVYTFQARATDRIGTVTTADTPIQSTPVFDWSSEDFTVRVPAYFHEGIDTAVLMINGKPFNPYPVGSIYMSVNSTSPASVFGGTWERLKDRFLLGSGDIYANGSVGGEEKHTLTVEEAPSHIHAMESPNCNYNLKTTAVVQWGGETNYWPIAHDNSGWNDGLMFSAGGDGAHNNMPPYLAVYIWKRIS